MIESLEETMESGQEVQYPLYIEDFLPCKVSHTVLEAAEYEHYDAMWALLNHGAPVDCDVRTPDGEEIHCTLFASVVNGKPELPWSKRQEIVENLIRRGFDNLSFTKITFTKIQLYQRVIQCFSRYGAHPVESIVGGAGCNKKGSRSSLFCWNRMSVTC